MAFSPDGKTIVTGSLEGRARLWNAAPGTQRGQPLLHDAAVTAVTFSRDGRLVLTASHDGTARLWDPDTGRPGGPPLRHPRKPGGDPFEVQGIAFSTDGSAVLTNGEDRTARVWSIAPFTQGSALLSTRLESLTGLTLDDDGVIPVLDTDAWTARRNMLNASTVSPSLPASTMNPSPRHG